MHAFIQIAAANGASVPLQFHRVSGGSVDFSRWEHGCNEPESWARWKWVHGRANRSRIQTLRRELDHPVKSTRWQHSQLPYPATVCAKEESTKSQHSQTLFCFLLWPRRCHCTRQLLVYGSLHTLLSCMWPLELSHAVHCSQTQIYLNNKNLKTFRNLVSPGPYHEIWPQGSIPSDPSLWACCLVINVLDCQLRGWGSNLHQGRNLVRHFCSTCAC